MRRFVEKPDVVTANSGASTASVLLGNGDGTFQAKVDYNTGDTPYGIAIADVSSDGVTYISWSCVPVPK